MDKLVWTDVESTGLSVTSDVMLELGLTMTDVWGGILEERQWLIREDSPRYEDAIRRARRNSIVGPMHEKSGLWSDLDLMPTVTIPQLIPQVLDVLDGWEVKHGEAPMCGSSVGFDRAFLAKNVPPLEAHFHYRNIDISTVKELCRRLNPSLYEKLDENTSKREQHRVLPDIQDTINEYKFYYENFFFVGEDV